MPFFRCDVDLCLVPDFAKQCWGGVVSHNCVAAITAFETYLKNSYRKSSFKWTQFMVQAPSQVDAVNKIIFEKVIKEDLKSLPGIGSDKVVLDPVTDKEWIPDPTDPTGRISRRTVQIHKSGSPPRKFDVSFDWRPNADTYKLEGWLGVSVYTRQCEGVE